MDDREQQQRTDAGRLATGSNDSLLILSFRHRDSLADDVTALGHRVVAARRVDGIGRRLLSLHCRLVILDGREAAVEALKAAERLSNLTRSVGAAILLLYDRRDSDYLPAFVDAGIDAMLAAPWQPAELVAALGLAQRNASGLPPTRYSGGQCWWQADREGRLLQIDATSDQQLRDSFPAQSSLRAVVASFVSEDRRRAFDAMRKLRAEGGYAAFVQRVPSGNLDGEFVHHLVLQGNRLAGQVEWSKHKPEVLDGQGSDTVTGLMDLSSAVSLVESHLSDRQEPLAISLVQLVGLDRYNDDAGFSAGDALLRSVARQLERAVRQEVGAEATVARVGGTRIAVIVPGMHSAARLDVGLRGFAAALADTTLAPAHSALGVRIATGLIEPGQMVNELLSRLARRLSSPRALVRELDVEAALIKGQVAIRFQPQYAMEDDGLYGAEALARWIHPKLGEIGGAALFSAAAAAGLQREVSAHVWRTALEAVALWPEALANVRVALNLTAADLGDSGFADRLLGMAHQAGVVPARLAVEVTESATIANFDVASSNLAALRQAGMHVALDDFGTGYSGLAWLKQLPVDYIKIDSGFARDASGAPRDRAVLGGIIELARTLSLDVLAEGVESISQRDQLKAMGCRWYQGFLKAPALDSSDFVRLMSSDTA
jgi:diguanylate cyclase (GGDEF)-like protein